MTDWRPDQPYNDLPPLPPAAEVETRPVLKQCIAARAALAELKQAAELQPSPLKGGKNVLVRLRRFLVIN